MSSYYLSPISQGLGDLIVSFPALDGLISTGVPTFLVVRGKVQKGLASRIPGLAGCLDEVDFDPSKLSPSDQYFNLRNHELQSRFTWGSPEFSQASKFLHCRCSERNKQGLQYSYIAKNAASAQF